MTRSLGCPSGVQKLEASGVLELETPPAAAPVAMPPVDSELASEALGVLAPGVQPTSAARPAAGLVAGARRPLRQFRVRVAGAPGGGGRRVARPGRRLRLGVATLLVGPGRDSATDRPATAAAIARARHTMAGMTQ